MKKTLVLIAAMVGMTSLSQAATVVGYWDDFSANTSTYASQYGTGNLVLSTNGHTGSSSGLDMGNDTYAANDSRTYAHIDLSSLSSEHQIGGYNLNDGFSIMMTVSDLSQLASANNLLWSCKDSSNAFRTGFNWLNTATKQVVGMWQGSSSGRQVAIADPANYTGSVQIVLTYGSTGFNAYFDGVKILSDAGLKWSSGALTDLYIGNWSSGQSNGNADFTLQSFAVYNGIVDPLNLPAIPEPTTAALGLLGLAGLAARRRRA